MASAQMSDLDVAASMATNRGGLKAVYGDFIAALNMAKDSIKGRYKVPLWAVALILAAAVYLLNPVDAVPDVIPVAGLADDAAVIAAMLSSISAVLKKYKAWKAGV